MLIFSSTDSFRLLREPAFPTSLYRGAIEAFASSYNYSLLETDPLKQKGRRSDLSDTHEN